MRSSGAPVVGAMVTFQTPEPLHSVTTFSDEHGRFATPAPTGAVSVRVRRIGFRDHWRELPADGSAPRALDLALERETDPAALAAQLPANRWNQLVLQRLPDDAAREEMKRQCTFCHQQGSAATRRPRDTLEWQAVIARMGRRGALLSPGLRATLPAALAAAYAPETAVAALTAARDTKDFAPPPDPAARRALIEEWELGGRFSTQHDVMVHPDGRIYAADMNQDVLHRLDVSVPGGSRAAWKIPHGDLPLGGAFDDDTGADLRALMPSDAHVGPHSLQTAPDGSIWLTLALANQLARFDPKTEEWQISALPGAWYPHTLRFDREGRIWYTLAASNQVGRFDPATGRNTLVRLPSDTWAQAAVLRALPLLMWLGRHVDLRGAAAESTGMNMPVPYGIDLAPDGGVWFSQLNARRIGRIDPTTLAVETIDTPFPGPRRLRFDAKGGLWIPSFSGGLVARFSPDTRRFETWALPIEPAGSDVPYALNVDRRTNAVWICGANSDTLLRFEPDVERFTVYPLPTRVTYTREIDFDAEGRVWTSSSNAPTWQIEDGVPRVLRLDPDRVDPEGARVILPRAAR